MQKLQAVFVDMDGTILESEVLWRQAPLRLLAEKGLVMPHEMFLRMPGLRGLSAIRLLTQCHVEGLDMTYEEILNWCVQDMQRLYRTTIALKPGARELLACLADRGISMALVTATNIDTTRATLSRHGVLDMFQLVHSTDGQALNKAHPALFEQLAAQLGVSVRDCALLDDSLYALCGAQEAGCAAWAIEDIVQLPDKARIHRMADRYFTHLDQVRALVEAGI